MISLSYFKVSPRLELHPHLHHQHTASIRKIGVEFPHALYVIFFCAFIFIVELEGLIPTKLVSCLV